MMGAVEGGHGLLVAILAVSSLLNIAYLIPIPVRAFFTVSAGSSGPAEIKEAPLSCLVARCRTSLACLILFFFANGLYQFLIKVVRL